MEDFIRAVLPHPDECRRKAQELRDAYPEAGADELVERAIKTAKRWAAIYGVGSGVATNPFAMVPAAAADMGLTMRAEAHLTGVIALLKVPSLADDTDGFHTDVLAVMFPNAVSQALREVGVQAGKATTRTLIRKYISGNLLKAIIAFAAKYLGIKLTQRAIISKTVPIVGAAIGATWNWIDVERCGRRAVKYFSEA
ncbi:MAG: hypothetical protein U0326_11890 [Polyangiales bacterium]